MSFGAEMAGVALDMIDEFGRDIVLRDQRRTPAAAGGSVTKNPIDYSVRSVIESFAAKEVDGETIKRGDIKLLVAGTALAAQPAADWSAFLGSDASAVPEHRVIHVDTTYAGDVPVLYTIQVRR